jgi:hypothetical protein
MKQLKESFEFDFPVRFAVLGIFYWGTAIASFWICMKLFS